MTVMNSEMSTYLRCMNLYITGISSILSMIKNFHIYLLLELFKFELFAHATIDTWDDIEVIVIDIKEKVIKFKFNF